MSAYDSTTQMSFSCVLTETLQPLSPSLYLHLVTFDLATLEQAARGTACERTGARKSSLPEDARFLYESLRAPLEQCLRSISATHNSRSCRNVTTGRESRNEREKITTSHARTHTRTRARMRKTDDRCPDPLSVGLVSTDHRPVA